jgi:hypothetical protein
VRLSGDGRVVIAVPGRPAPLVAEAGSAPHIPNEWCAREQVYRAHIRLEDAGIAGATFGVATDGTLDWIPPQDAGCVDWAAMDAAANVPKEVIMAFRLQRLLPGALLWVLDGDAAQRGRLYEVGEDGLARYVSAATWAAQSAHFQEAWPNVLPVSWRQMEDFVARGLVGADL